MRIRLPLFLCAFVALLLAAGCERPEGVGLTAEVDEANYRRGKDFLRQGRNQEALASFLKVIEKRGDGAPESHLEVGLLYQKIKDPIAAIYHFRKFRELKPNSSQADLVRQQVDAAMREFGSTLPAQPLENQLLRNDQLDIIEALRRENAELKNELAIARANAASPTASRGTVAQIDPLDDPRAVQPERRSPYAVGEQSSPITRVPPEPDPAAALIQPPTRPPATPAPTAPATTGRRHVVAAKDSLYSIARKYYGNATNAKIDEIVAANRNLLPDGRNTALRVGMELRIP